MSFPRFGGCQCGAVRYKIAGPPVTVYACHCTECQTQSGSAFAMAAVIPKESFRFTKGSPARWTRQIGPDRKTDCWFCAACGTRVVHVPGGEASPIRNVKPGTLDDTSWLAPAIHYWTRSAQKWVAIPGDATRHETQPETLSWMAPKT